jgi:soluble lytic murein transglycosylase-like protein
MVKRFCAAALMAGLASGANAQAVDWRGSGGDLFGRPFVERETVDADEATPRLAALSQPFQDAIDQAAEAHGLDPKLLHALVLTESAYQPRAVSPVGAGGLTQLMPATARELGVRDRFDPIENLRGGADYLARQLLRFGDVRLALAAYNAGPSRVARLGRIPDFQETRDYVATVVECYLALTAGKALTSARQCRSAGEAP